MKLGVQDEGHTSENAGQAEAMIESPQEECWPMHVGMARLMLDQETYIVAQNVEWSADLHVPTQLVFIKRP
jgi:hypothetical protein